MINRVFATVFHKWWTDQCWRSGVRLDKMGCWMLLHAPALGRLYAAILTGQQKAPHLVPRWTFGYEYYVERRWLALRRGALWEFALERGLAVPVTVPWHERTRIELTLGNDMSLCLYVAGSFEPNEFAFLDKLLEPGMTFIDIGANEGLFSLFAARRVGVTGRVVSVEPSSRERRQLERNLRRNRSNSVTVVPHAVAEKAGTARLQIAAKLHGGHNTLGSFSYDDVSAVDTEDVPVETLDALAQRLRLERIDTIKIDVEGAELKVLRGGIGILKTCRPVLLIEANERALAGQGASTAAMTRLLEDLGYEIRVFSERTGEVERLVPGSALSANIVAIPQKSPP